MDQEDCIISIKELPQSQRQRGIKLYLLIGNNIINNPNERKYKFLHYDKICKKFNKMEIFINLMLHSGFKRFDKSKTVLVFNSQYIQLLKESMKAVEKLKEFDQETCSDEYEIKSSNILRRRRSILISNDVTQVRPVHTICFFLFT